MKKYYFVDPEVAGNIAYSDFQDRTARPPLINKLKYQFDGWSGSDIVKSIMTFIVTERLKNALESKGLTGFEFDDVEISVSEEFEELSPGKSLPKFYWLKINGVAGAADFGLAKYRLVISDSALNLLKEYNMSIAEIEEYNE